MSIEATFYANETVTAEQLNQIAVDLGLTSYNKFPENPPQSAVSALNQITSDLINPGVLNINNRLAVSQDDNNLYVATGVAVFADGAKIRITSSETVSKSVYTEGVYYLYLYNNTTENKAQLVFSATAPTGDYVMLAEYDAGTITDKRKVCSAKIALPLNNTAEVFSAVKLQNKVPVPLGNVNLQPSMLFYNAGYEDNGYYDFKNDTYRSYTRLRGTSHTYYDKIVYVYGDTTSAHFKVSIDNIGNVSLTASWGDYDESSVPGKIYLI